MITITITWIIIRIQSTYPCKHVIIRITADITYVSEVGVCKIPLRF